MECCETQLADSEHISVAQRAVFHAVAVRLLIVSTKDELCASGFRQCGRTGGKIGMDVCFCNVLDGKPLLVRVLRIAIEVTHGSITMAFPSDERM